jgi:hypothetical protein
MITKIITKIEIELGRVLFQSEKDTIVKIITSGSRWSINYFVELFK